MGGGIHGDVASETVVRVLYDFFMKSDISLYDDVPLLKKKTEELIDSCDELLISKFGVNTIGTTLCMGYVLKNKTLIINIGDSRRYKYEDSKLVEVKHLDYDTKIESVFSEELLNGSYYAYSSGIDGYVKIEDLEPIGKIDPKDLICSKNNKKLYKGI